MSGKYDFKVTCELIEMMEAESKVIFNSFTSKSVPAGTKLVLFGRYVLKFYVGIVL